MISNDLSNLLVIELYDGLDTVLGLLEILIYLITDIDHPQYEDRDLSDEEDYLVADHRPKDVFKGIVEFDLGGVDEALVGSDIHVEVGEVLSCAVGWQFIQRLDGRDHVVNEIDLIVADSFVETVVLKGVINFRDVESRIEDGLKGHWVAHQSCYLDDF